MKPYPVLVNDMQTPHPLKKSRCHFLIQIVAQCSETNERKKLRFLIFQVINDVVHNFQVFLTNFLGISKDAQCSESDFVFLSFFLCDS